MENMKLKCIQNIIYGIIVFVFSVGFVSAQDPEHKPPNEKSVFRLSERDIILPITSIEWGSPDRWSITSRYIRELDERKEKRTWHNNLSVSISPGISGGRIGFGYLGLFDPQSMSDFGVFFEARAVLLRTWGNPLSTSPNRTFWGGELRVALSFLLNLGVGYYKQLSNSDGLKDSFYGFHIGVGI
ncbi:MAG: hypothetical protein JSW64_13660 [Candidatus Zixiibacteriota bacterium]|nr:MAG: hypothetical protein JSW64_13660 [candidate division Zixibacteria bacterium]